jgi:glucose/arabinose dehydrogenase
MGRLRPGGMVEGGGALHRFLLAGATLALLVACTGQPAPQPTPPASAGAAPSASERTTPPASAGESSPPGQEPRPVRPTGSPRDAATGLRAPWSVVFLGRTALISERDTARILELRPDGTTRVVGTVLGVRPVAEAGLLGLAVDDRGRLYAYSTGADRNRVQRFPVRGRPGSLRLGTPTTILDGIPAAVRHDGGRIAFGPDGMLYVATGDTLAPSLAQDRSSLAGKILRMTPDGEVPADNPFPGSLVYSYGHRNVQGLAWAPDGTMFATEFGQDAWDELNEIEPGANYGWPRVEGKAGVAAYVDPVQQWRPDRASPSGLTVAGGTLFVANLRGAVLRAIPVADPATSSEHYAGRYGRLRDVTVSPEGDLWILTNNTDGRGDPQPGDDRILRVPLT